MVTEAQFAEAIERAMLAELEEMHGPISMLTQADFPIIYNAAMFEFHGQALDSHLLARMVTDKLCLIMPERKPVSHRKAHRLAMEAMRKAQAGELETRLSEEQLDIEDGLTEFEDDDPFAGRR